MTSRVIGLNGEALPPEFYAFARGNESTWVAYHPLAELEKAAYTTGLIVTPAEGLPRAMMLTQLDVYPSLLRQLTVIWTGGSTEQGHVNALVRAAEAMATLLSCTRIHVSACALLYRQMKLEGFRPLSVNLVKDI